jgi:hypothetical protein
MRTVQRHWPRAVGVAMTRKVAQNIYRLTTGRKVYLEKHPLTGRWHVTEDRDAGLQGNGWASPSDAIGALWKRLGFLRVPKEMAENLQ